MIHTKEYAVTDSWHVVYEEVDFDSSAIRYDRCMKISFVQEGLYGKAAVCHGYDTHFVRQFF